MSTFTRTLLPSETQSSSTASPLKRKAMSISQTYFLAHTARGKLSHEASRSDHNLRLLVGHANLLDSIMLDLAQAEQEQESWFNQSVKGATKNEEKHIQWADSIIEEPEEDWEAEDADESSDSDSEFSDDDAELESAGFLSLHRVQSHTAIMVAAEEEDDEEEYEDDQEDDYAALSLSRSPSHSVSPPELDDDSDSSEDESMPPSPPTSSLPSFSEKQRQQIATTSYYETESSDRKLSPTQQAQFFNEGFYIPRRQAPTLVSAVSVY
jgi:hypothetical protein